MEQLGDLLREARLSRLLWNKLSETNIRLEYIQAMEMKIGIFPNLLLKVF